MKHPRPEQKMSGFNDALSRSFTSLAYVIMCHHASLDYFEDGLFGHPLDQKGSITGSRP
jgi:hypothetical protein